MQVEVWLFFEGIAMLLLFATIYLNRSDTGRRIPWVIPAISLFLFVILMFTPLTNKGYLTIINKNNVTDRLDYSYDIADSGSYFELALVNFAFVIISALYLIYSMVMETHGEMTKALKSFGV